MLILGRSTGQSVIVDNKITVKVLSISKGNVQLGFGADRSVPIRREELKPLEPKERAG